MATPKTILLMAASGNVGRVLAPMLRTQHPAPKLVLPTTNVDGLKKSNMAAAQGPASEVVIEQGNIRDPVWFGSILRKHNVDAVLLCVTGTNEMFTTLNCLDVMAKSNTVKKVVYISIVGDFTSEAGHKALYRDRGYPHIFAKAVAEQKLIHANYPFDWTVLGPTFFFENDLRQKIPLTQMGMYSEPDISKGGCKIACEDIALAACNIFMSTDSKWSKRKILLGSQHSYTTAESAGLWSQALGKKIQSLAASKEALDQCEQTLRKMIGEDVDASARAHNLRLLYEYATTFGIHISEEDYRDQVELLGKVPDDYGDWVKKTAASWL